MASAKKCDICGKFYDPPICNDVVRIQVNIYRCDHCYIDLCDDCYDKLCDTVRSAIPKDCCIERHYKKIEN